MRGSAAHPSETPNPIPKATSRAAAALAETNRQLLWGSLQAHGVALPQRQTQEALGTLPTLHTVHVSHHLRSYAVACPKGPLYPNHNRKLLQKGPRVSIAPDSAICDPNKCQLIPVLMFSRERLFLSRSEAPHYQSRNFVAIQLAILPSTDHQSARSQGKEKGKSDKVTCPSVLWTQACTPKCCTAWRIWGEKRMRAGAGKRKFTVCQTVYFFI